MTVQVWICHSQLMGSRWPSSTQKRKCRGGEVTGGGGVRGLRHWLHCHVPFVPSNAIHHMRVQ
jgi:hypothetical protein